MILILGHIAGTDMPCKKNSIRFGVIQLRGWREVEPNDMQELSKGGFHDKVSW